MLGILYGIVIVGICIALSLLGMLIRGIVTIIRGNARNDRVMIRRGVIILVIALIANGAFWGETIKYELRKRSYKCVADEWRAVSAYDVDARNKILNSLLESTGNGDEKTFVREFAFVVQYTKRFRGDAEAFLNAFDPDINNVKRWDSKFLSSQGSVRDDDRVREEEVYRFTGSSDKKTYYIYLHYCKKDKTGKKVAKPEVGVLEFYIYTDDTKDEFDAYIKDPNRDVCVKYF